MTTTSDLLTEPAPAEPMAIVSRWLRDACERRLQPNPNAMVLATLGADRQPSARVVLLKDLVIDPGYLVFYSNYDSRKGRELAAAPRAAAVMHWDQLQRQVRITGPVVRAPAAQSDAYFASRPWPSRIAAWASDQSQSIGSHADLVARVSAAARRFGTPNPADAVKDGADYAIARPPHWGGYRLWAENVELWQEGRSRIHDRFSWSRKLTADAASGFACGPWSVVRLQP
ncbi:MAG TPA: pyridoxamine 5'-phosphate oxidase [Steroidobacteraceae bacterium]